MDIGDKFKIRNIIWVPDAGQKTEPDSHVIGHTVISPEMPETAIIIRNVTKAWENKCLKAHDSDLIFENSNENVYRCELIDTQFGWRIGQTSAYIGYNFYATESMIKDMAKPMSKEDYKTRKIYLNNLSCPSTAYVGYSGLMGLRMRDKIYSEDDENLLVKSNFKENRTIQNDPIGDGLKASLMIIFILAGIAGICGLIKGLFG